LGLDSDSILLRIFSPEIGFAAGLVEANLPSGPRNFLQFILEDFAMTGTKVFFSLEFWSWQRMAVSV
jgi:hypothetical protein